jgi:DNA polymerase-3 subunit epsilon/oligoribonuclease
LDIETTGLDFRVHVPIDIAIVIKDLHNYKTLVEYTSCITCDAKDWDLSDKKALAKNGFNKDCIWQGTEMSHVSKTIITMFLQVGITKSNSFFFCQNPSFDRPFFHDIVSQNEMNELNFPHHWLDLASMFFLKCLSPNCKIGFNTGRGRPEKRSSPLSKDSIAKSLGLLPEEKPHRAMNGVKHLIQCYEALISL